MNLQEIWSQLTPGQLTAGALTADGAALGDEDGLLLILSAEGERLIERPLPSPIRDIASSADGKHIAVACGDGEIVLIANGKILFRHSPGTAVSMVGIGPHGDYLLGLSPAGEGVFLNSYGREMGRIHAECGALSAAVVPETGEIVVVGRRGVVQGFASWGKPLWRTELTGSTGRIATDSRGELMLVPVMAFGVEALTSGGRHVGAYDVGEPVKAAACSGDGQALLFATSDDRLVLLRRDATVVNAEAFPAPIASVEMSRDGDRALVTTGSGYAHLLAVSDGEGPPLLEIGQSTGGSRPHYLLRKRVFSPFSILIQARLDFFPDGSRVGVAGDRKRVQVLDLEGEEIASRRWGGSLLDIVVMDDGAVRVFATQSVFRFNPDDEGSNPEWTGRADLSRLALSGRNKAVATTDDGEVLGFRQEPSRAKSLFYLPDPKVADLAYFDGIIAVSMKDGSFLLYSEDGEELGRSGPYPFAPRILAANGNRLLVSVKKLLVLLAPDGEEIWRHHLSAPVRAGLEVAGTFLVVDEAGTAWTVTSKGVIRRAFAVGSGKIVPFTDAGEGPGFIVAEGDLVTAIHPDGSPRWRFRTPDSIAHARCSPDGRHAGVLAGLELFVLPVLRERGAGERPKEAVEYLEFADG